MAQLTCLCGNSLSNIESPNEVEGLLLRDVDMSFDEADSIQISDIGRHVWECGKCGRLSISYPKKEDMTVKWYIPEDGNPGNLMRFK